MVLEYYKEMKFKETICNSITFDDYLLRENLSDKIIDFIYKLRLLGIFIYIIKLKINLKKYFTMSCGCKNKNNGTQAQPAQNAQPSQAQQVKSPTIQESIKKVVEKYYNKK